MLTICQEILGQVVAYAIKHYPSEACGFLIGEKGQASVTEFLPIKNSYDEMHAKYPETYPRTSKTAYLIDPREQQKTFDDVEKNGQEIKAIFHSHTDHDAYFSDEDRLVAAPWGDLEGPMYPGVAYLVVSIYDRKLKELNLYEWNERLRNFEISPIK